MTSFERTPSQPIVPEEEPSSSETARKGIHFDPGYVATRPGMIKVAQAVIGLIGFISAQTVRTKVYKAAGGWYTFVSLPAFFISTIFVLCYVFHIVERFKRLPWLLTEMGYAIAWCILFFIAGCIAATRIRKDPPWGAATFFAFVGMAVFGYEAFMKYGQWKKDEPAQGTRSQTDTSNADLDEAEADPSTPF